MIKQNLTLLLLSCLTVSVSCQQNKTTANNIAESPVTAKTVSTEEIPVQNKGYRKPADAKTILSRKQVPILCYHQIRNWKATDSKAAKDYIIQINTFKEHIKLLADSGYHSVLPDQVYNYLVYGDPLPSKPVMLTFDDTDLDQFTIAAPELKKYGFKAVYFIMTVSLGRPHYMTKDQVKKLSDDGNIIGSHTWDHHNVKKYQGQDWVTQIDKPTKTLETITGKDINYFAFPFGLWNKEAIPELKKRGFKAAYILSTSRDEVNPLFTIRRIIASGYWSAKTLHNSMVNSFAEKRN
ncbi:MAG TPA: polysaccharide deacetylase [Sphingobacteriaceae bacterium]|nr:polysaccharide deacetylase [Sphingobacteriaceae bacterium]